jgi:hypothetical protein
MHPQRPTPHHHHPHTRAPLLTAVPSRLARVRGEWLCRVLLVATARSTVIPADHIPIFKFIW